MKERATKRWWIKERRNPQLGTYYVACGKMSIAAAKREESPLYGTNIMHEYLTEADYKSKIHQLENSGNHVQ